MRWNLKNEFDMRSRYLMQGVYLWSTRLTVVIYGPSYVMDKVIHCSSVSPEPGDLPHDRYHSKFVPTTRICGLVEKLTSHVM